MPKLSPTQRAVLRCIVHPKPCDEPFPPVRTVRVLIRLGLVKVVDIRKHLSSASPMDIIMSALVGPRLEATPAGRAALQKEEEGRG